MARTKLFAVSSMTDEQIAARIKAARDEYEAALNQALEAGLTVHLNCARAVQRPGYKLFKLKPPEVTRTMVVS